MPLTMYMTLEFSFLFEDFLMLEKMSIRSKKKYQRPQTTCHLFEREWSFLWSEKLDVQDLYVCSSF